MNNEELLTAILGLDSRFAKEEKANSAAVQIPSDVLFDLSVMLKQNPTFHFDLLLSHTAVHWLEEGQFELLYKLYSTTTRSHLMLTTRVAADSPSIASVAAVWRIAEWQEREVFDLFGVVYTGHPDLRRLFLEDDWQGYPLRKDYQDDFMLEGPFDGD